MIIKSNNKAEKLVTQVCDVVGCSEINASSREKFWKEVRAQENTRIAEERKREKEKNDKAIRERYELSERIHAQLCLEEQNKNLKTSRNSSTGYHSLNIVFFFHKHGYATLMNVFVNFFKSLYV